MVEERGCGGGDGLWWRRGVVVEESGRGGVEGLWWRRGAAVEERDCGVDEAEWALVYYRVKEGSGL